MSSLILTVLSIALLSAIAVITINYLPSWSKERTDVAAIVRLSPRELERAFNLYAKSHTDVPATVITTDADGGLRANFHSLLGFSPMAVPGYQWVYGDAGTAGPGGFATNYYFCMTPTAVGGLSTEGKVRGVLSAQQYLAPEQAFVSTGCGIPGNVAYDVFPAAMSFTYFVRYVPGQL